MSMLKCAILVEEETSCYVELARLPELPEGFSWKRGPNNWVFLVNHRERAIIWISCGMDSRLAAGFMLGDGYRLSLTEEKEQIIQLLAKWRIVCLS